MRQTEEEKEQRPYFARMRRAVTRVEPAMWDWDLETEEFHASEQLRQIYGFRSDKIDFAQLVEATHPQDRGWEETLVERTELGNPEHAFRILNGETGDFRWLRVKVVTEFSKTTTPVPIAYTAIVEDETERTHSAYALLESEERFRLAIEAGRMAVWEVDLETGTVSNSPELNLLFGFPIDSKPTFAEFRSRYAPGEIERLAREGATLEEVRRQFASGKFEASSGPNPNVDRDPTQVQAEVSIVAPGGQVKHLLYRAQYIYSLEGRPKITGLLVDITDRKDAEERLNVIARELQHRVKNSLTLVQSLARLSLRSQTVNKDSVDRFLTRLSALATATNLVLDSSTSDARLEEVVEYITRPYRDPLNDPFSITGPSQKIPAKTASSLGLILHELCTNAVKYGALSEATGRVEILWRRNSDHSLSLWWRESGGPPVAPPKATGFGSRLISALVAGDLKGEIKAAYPETGAEVEITAKI